MGLISRYSTTSRRRCRAFALSLETLESRVVPTTGPMLGLSAGPVSPDLLQLANVSALAPSADFVGPILRERANAWPTVEVARPTTSYGLGASFITHDSRGRIGVEISADDPGALVGPLQGLGATVT